MIKELQVFVSGKVQGVGFRVAVKRHAGLFQILGYVHNLQDGRVEIYAQGEAEALEAFLKVVQEKPGLGTVTSLETYPRTSLSHFFDFEIR